MIIPIPCKLGDNFITKEGLKILKHVTFISISPDSIDSLTEPAL